jgi:diacylglycerol kinase family enzyme
MVEVAEVADGRRVALWRSRVLAGVALAALAAAAVVAVVAVVGDVGRLLAAVVAVAALVGGAWRTATGTGLARLAGAVVATVAGVVLVVLALGGLGALVVAGLLVVAWAAAGGAHALAPPPPLRGVPVGPARHPVLIVNPRSGGGKAAKADLARRAGERGIEVVELVPGDDLTRLAEQAVADGADVLGMAGGDGSQALVAAVAARHGVGYVCIPAGTRNHLALDLGLDRADVVGALDAFGSAIARTIDLAMVNGRTFVNNVSLGVYASIVQSPEYRDAKRATVASMLPELLGPEATPPALSFVDDVGVAHHRAQMVQVSNNPYALGAFAGFGTRPRLDGGRLGVVAVEVAGEPDVRRLVAAVAAGHPERYRGWSEWTASTFEVQSPGAVPVGIDGEAVWLEPPLRFEACPGALQVRVPTSAPGAAPAARRERSLWQLLRGPSAADGPRPSDPETGASAGEDLDPRRTP